MRLYNTLTRKIEELELEPGKEIRLYTCGPTVYNFAHIGNLRSYIAADTLRRALAFHGARVKWVMNITDVDDKTIRKTIEKYGIHATVDDLRALTGEYLEAFRKNLAEVNIPTDPEHVVFIRVADVIPEIIAFIKELLRKGYAYKTEDGVFFSIEKYERDFGNYGKLVGEGFLEGKKIGARVKVDEYEKENLSDFALWKARSPEDGNIFWSDPELGEGRPGWHIECSVINKIAFGGESTDIHTGGVDLIFPHHTNEIAQSEPLYRPFARHWSHAEHLMVEGKKMAKSEGNFFTLEDLKVNRPMAGIAFRYLALQTNYRVKMNFLLANLDGAMTALRRIKDSMGYEPVTPEMEDGVKNALGDDLNTSEALAVINKAEKKDIRALLEVLGLNLEAVESEKPLANDEIPSDVSELLIKRQEARTNKQFIQSDAFRDELDALGYRVIDGPDGQVLYKK